MMGYKEIMETYRVAGKLTVWNSQTHEQVRINVDDYDVVVAQVGKGYYCNIYEVIKNAPKLSEQELALVCDEGNLCFGYDIRDGRIAVYTD